MGNDPKVTLVLRLPVAVAHVLIASASEKQVSLEDEIVLMLGLKSAPGRGPGGQKSGFKGVYRYGSRWRAVIRHQGNEYVVGVFDDPAQASRARGEAWERVTVGVADATPPRNRAGKSVPAPRNPHDFVTVSPGNTPSESGESSGEFDVSGIMDMVDVEEIMAQSRQNKFVSDEVFARAQAEDEAARDRAKDPAVIAQRKAREEELQKQTEDYVELERKAHKSRAARAARAEAAQPAPITLPRVVR